MTQSPIFLVSGAGGHLGRRVVELLLAQGAGRVIAGSRSPDKLADLAAKGAETRKVDFDDPELATAFEGVDRLLIISTDALGEPGWRLRQHKAAIAAAQKAGVKHVVYTSMPNPEPGSPIPFAPDHLGSEQALAASSFNWTVLRNSWYAENLHYSLPQVLASGQWYTSAGEGRTSYVTREDCAQAAAAALIGASNQNSRYDITGSEALSVDDIASIAGEVFGKAINVVQLSDEQLAQGMAAAGVPAPFVPLFVSFDANARSGRIADVSGDVARLTGRAPQKLRDFLAANKAAFQPAA